MHRLNQRLTFNLVFSAALAASSVDYVGAAENYILRYAPGNGGADMSGPLEAGFYFQMPSYVYSGKLTTVTNVPVDLTAQPFNVPIPGASASTPVTSVSNVSAAAISPALVYMSTERLFGATVGFGASLPLVQKKSNGSLAVGQTSLSPSASLLPAANQAALASGINAGITQQAQGAALSSSNFGVGDLEVGGLMRWGQDPILLA